MKVQIISDPKQANHNTGSHPETAGRIDVALKSLSLPELTNSLNFVKAKAATIADVQRCHESALIERIDASCRQNMTYVDMLRTHICPDSYSVALHAAGAALQAVDHVMSADGTRAFGLVRPPGHHATINRALGFCLFNNVAVGVRYAQVKYGVEKVLVVDWDVHHGNGTQEIFWNDPSVFYFSMHQSRLWPGTGCSDERGSGPGEGFTLNIPVPAGTSGRAYRQVFSDALQAIGKVFSPDLVFISAGFDASRGDPLGGLMLEGDDFYEITRRVVSTAEKGGSGRIVSMLEGGYNLHSLGAMVRSHIGGML